MRPQNKLSEQVPLGFVSVYYVLLCVRYRFTQPERFQDESLDRASVLLEKVHAFPGQTASGVASISRKCSRATTAAVGRMETGIRAGVDATFTAIESGMTAVFEAVPKVLKAVCAHVWWAGLWLIERVFRSVEFGWRVAKKTRKTPFWVVKLIVYTVLAVVSLAVVAHVLRQLGQFGVLACLAFVALPLLSKLTIKKYA